MNLNQSLLNIINGRKNCMDEAHPFQSKYIEDNINKYISFN